MATELTEVFWISFITTISAMIGLTIKMCLRSRCDQIEICGLKIHRQVDLENQEVNAHPNMNLSASTENIRL